LGWGVTAVANYGYTLPRFDEYFTANRTINLTGFRPRFTYRHVANLWLTKLWKSGFTASLGARYISSQFVDDPDTVRLGGYTLFSGAVGYRRGIYELRVNAENLLDRGRYFDSGISGKPGISRCSNQRICDRASPASLVRRVVPWNYLSIPYPGNRLRCWEHRWKGAASTLYQIGGPPRGALFVRPGNGPAGPCS